MDPDTSLVIGLALAILSVPAIVSAISDRRTPRVATITMMIGGALIVYAINTKQIAYTLDQIPDVILRVIGQVIP